MILILSERNVLHRLKRKDERALEWIIDHYAPYVSTIVYNIIGGALPLADVEEISSDVFWTLWLNAQKVENGKLKAYLGAVARNKAREKCRSIGKDLALEEDAILLSETDLQTEMEEQEQADFLRRAVLAMGIPDKEIFLRHYYYCQGVSQIAREMELSLSVVKVRLFRGRKKLKQILCEGGYYIENEYL